MYISIANNIKYLFIYFFQASIFDKDSTGIFDGHRLQFIHSIITY